MKRVSFSIICVCMLFGFMACDDITQVDEVLAGEIYLIQALLPLQRLSWQTMRREHR